MQGRYHVSFEDIRALAQPVFRHRILTNFHAESERVTRPGSSSSCWRRCRCRGRECDAASDRCPKPTVSRFLRPEVLARIGNLELLARTVVEGFLSGLHRSPYLGRSIDFAEHRGYMPGDDIRRIDWRLFARTDRFYLKEFEADTNTDFVSLLDVSRSMRFTQPRAHQARLRALPRRLPGLLRPQAARPRRARHLRRGHRGLRPAVGQAPDHRAAHPRPRWTARSTPGRRASSRGRCARPRRPASAASILVLISDLYEDPRAVLSAVAALSHRGSDLIVFHLLDPAELAASRSTSRRASRTWRAASGFRSCPTQARARYRELVARAHRQPLAACSGENRIDYALIDTSQPLDHALFQLPVAPRAAGAVALMGLPRPALPGRPRRPRRARPRPPDAPGAQRDRAVPVADVPAAHPVPVVAAADAPPLAAASRCAARRIALLVAAFARPFLGTRGAGGRARRAGPRRASSCSTARAAWPTATAGAGAAAARRAVARAGPARRASLVLFAPRPRRPASRRWNAGGSLRRARRGAPGFGVTRYAPALRMAAEMLDASPPARPRGGADHRLPEAGWDGGDDVRLPAGHQAHPVDVSERGASNVAITGVDLSRDYEAGPRAGGGRGAPREQGRAAGEATWT